MTDTEAMLADLTRDQLADYARRAGIKVRGNASRDTLVAVIAEAVEERKAGNDPADDAHLGYPGQPGHPAE